MKIVIPEIVIPEDKECYVRADDVPIWYRWDFYCKEILKLEEKFKEKINRDIEKTFILNKIRNRKFAYPEFQYIGKDGGKIEKHEINNNRLKFKIVEDNIKSVYQSHVVDKNCVRVFFDKNLIGTITYETDTYPVRNDPMIGESVVVGYETEEYFFFYENIPKSRFYPKSYIMVNKAKKTLNSLLFRIIKAYSEKEDYCTKCFGAKYILNHYKQFYCKKCDYCNSV